MDIKALLRSFPLFEDLSAEQVDWLATHFGEVMYEPGETVWEEGVVSEEFLVLVEGEIDLLRRSAEQERFVATTQCANEGKSGGYSEGVAVAQNVLGQQ